MFDLKPEQIKITNEEAGLKCKHISRYNTIEDAVKARDKYIASLSTES